MSTINIEKAAVELAELMERARAGEDIVIADAAGNAVRLSPVPGEQAAKTSSRGRGLLKGKAQVSDDDLFGSLPDEELRSWWAEDKAS
ncbi:MAG: hypothetical protein ABL907_18475 [Hyphomicrobium sp.]